MSVAVRWRIAATCSRLAFGQEARTRVAPAETIAAANDVPFAALYSWGPQSE
jgi:hypothetical protein